MRTHIQRAVPEIVAAEVHDQTDEPLDERGPRIAASTFIPRTIPRTPSNSTLHAVQSLLYIIIIAIFIISFVVQPFRIPSESMEPTLMVGDFLLVAKLDVPHFGTPHTAFDGTRLFPATAIRRGDIVVFHYPIDPSLHLVKRVVGLPGDRLKLRNGRVYVNDHALDEPYAAYRPSPPDNFRDNFPRLQNPDPDVASNWWILMRSLVNRGELTIPPANFFVLGDNRNDSEDSRYWGFVPAAAIVGKPLLIYFSLAESSRDDSEAASPLSAPPGHEAQRHTTWKQFAGFARWDRVLRVVH